MTVIKRLIHIELPTNSIYHVVTDEHEMKIMMKCEDTNVYAPVAGVIAGYSQCDRTISIVIDESKAPLVMHLPAVATELITFYVNPGERVTSGLKLADLKALTNNLLVTTVTLDKNCHYEVCKRHSLI